ncbi:Uncharacterised protein [Vibrio cholerae]|nr:Uncharacterised protein [Vibrio cholerae]
MPTWFFSTSFSSSSFFSAPAAHAEAFASSWPACKPIALGLIPSTAPRTISRTCCCFGVS